MKDQAQSSPSCEIYGSLSFSYAYLKIYKFHPTKLPQQSTLFQSQSSFSIHTNLNDRLANPIHSRQYRFIQQNKVWLMLSSFSKHLSDSRHYTVTLDSVLNFISILVVDELNDMIFTCRLTPDDFPVTLLQIFQEKMEVLYEYLGRDDSQMEIRQDMEGISIWYSLIVLKKTVNKQIRMATKKYLLAKDSAFYPTKSQSQQKMDMSDSFDHAEYLENTEQLWKEHLKYCNDQLIMSKIHCIKTPNWFINTQPQLLLRLGGKIPRISHDQGRSRYQVSIKVGQFDRENGNRYDLTIGIAHPSRLEQIKQGYKGNQDEISLSVLGRVVTSRCLQLLQTKTQEKVVQMSRLSIELIEIQKQTSKRFVSIGFLIDQKLINQISEQKIASMNHLTNLNEYLPFVYFHRSFLHFSFDLESYTR